MKFAVMGGDGRMAHLAALLDADGHEVTAYYMGTESCCLSADVVILPAPAQREPGCLNAPSAGRKVPLCEALGFLQPGHLVLAGIVTPELRELCESNGARVVDYFKREELVIKNADLTAEGAVGVIVTETDFSLNGESVLVVGAGRIGRLTALKLRGLGADVTLSARKAADLAYAEALGMRPEVTGGWKPRVYDVVVNTVPAPVVTETVLGMVRAGGIVVDLASAPGGVDKDAANKLGVRVLHELGVPGRLMAATAAKAVRDTVYNILVELECPD